MGFVVAAREPTGVAHIVTIDVLQEFRRQGVGTKLMSVAETWARKTRMQLIYLETAEDNLAAQKFYEGRGYRKVETIERYYTTGQAAWVMIKRLKP